MMEEFLYGFFFSLLIASIAYWRRSLTGSGVMMAVIVGTQIYALGSIYWYGLLLVFFISASVLSHYKKKKKHQVEQGRFEKTGRRDGMQVLANGGLGMVLVWCAAASSNPAPFMAFYIGVMATVTADTWGTEIGILSHQHPRSILTGKRVEKGTSGGISAWGTMGTALGSLCIGVFAAFFLWLLNYDGATSWILFGFISGFVGALLDSVLGATVQRMFTCSVCGCETEKEVHCHTATTLKRGAGWCNNDLVNLLSSAGGGVTALLCWMLTP